MLSYHRRAPVSTAVFQRGQALVFALFTSVLVILALFVMYSMGNQVVEKIRLQNTADAAAYSAVVAEARDYNYAAYTNRAMIANQVAVAQFVGMTSWFRNMSAFANGDASNAGRDIYELFMFNITPSPLSNIYKRFLRLFGKATGIFDEGKAGTTVMSAAVTVFDGLIAIYGETQNVMHYATALTVAQTLGVFGSVGSNLDALLNVNWFSGLSALDTGSIIAANDPDVRLTLAGLPHLAMHYYKWFTFTERKDPNTADMDGPNAERFAQVTMDSLDDFSRDRSTKPAWGFSFIYAPPLTFIDPTRFIPGQSGPLFYPVIHRGGTELKVTDVTGNSGTAGSGGGDGTTGVDCHGNAVTAGSSSPVQVDQHSELAAYSASACDGDSGMVAVGNATHPKGVYVFKSGNWIDPATLSNTTGSSSGRTTPAADGSKPPTPRGTKSKKSWTALDASSWAGVNIFWIGPFPPILPFPLPLPLPFAPPFLPLSHGAAQSGTQLSKPAVLGADNNFGVDAPEAYGGALDHWTTRLPAEMRQAKGAGPTLDKVAALGGLRRYWDIKDTGADNLFGPPLVVEVEKKVSALPTNPGSGQFKTESGAPKTLIDGERKMRALTKAQVVFSRPTDDSSLDWFKRSVGSATSVELGSLYSPYWQPRLMPNNFLEQYISMELHRAGI